MSKGLKRICMNCGARFYDLDKSPIICPSCGTEFTGEIKVKSRRGRPPAEDKPVKAAEKAAPVVDEDDVEDIDPDDDIVSLDDVDEDDDVKADEEDDDAANMPSDLDDNFDSIDDEEDDIEEEEEETK